jgi:Spy/CpxP family protein refolding chaperone
MQDMKFTRQSAAAALFAASFAAFFATSAAANGETEARRPAAAERAEADRGPGQGPHGFGGSGPGAPGPDAPFGRGPKGQLGHLRHLDLSEAQQDKLFAITYAAEPQRRAQEKAERKAQETLRALGSSGQFDEAKANAAARDLGQAIAAGALLQARVESQVLAVLTAEQREQLRKSRPPGGREGGPQAAPQDAPQGGPQGAPQGRP